MTDETPQVVSTGPTARVADGYGVDPHEHKPSQDPFAPDVDEETAEAKQAVSAGAAVDDEVAEKAAQPYPEDDGTSESADVEEGDEPWDGNSSSTSQSDSESTSPENASSDSSPAPSAASRTARAPRGSSTAPSTATSRSTKSARA